MLLRLSNSPRDYAWGSSTAISDLLGTPPSGRPEAELWLGAHPGSPAVVETVGSPTLDEWIAADPARALQGATELPFLMKVLAAAEPLSLQVHPSAQQAAEGFARENAAGIPIDAPERNYRDDRHKPELIVALSDPFVALSGFRPLHESTADLAAIAATDSRATTASAFITALAEILEENAETALAWVVETLLRGGRAAGAIVTELIAAASSPAAREVGGSTAQTILDLGQAHPGDPGVLIGALLNRVELRRGEALFLPAGNVHAYLKGVGIEVMSSSDNVLRGGLTSKHIDIDEVLRVADFGELAEPRLAGIVRSQTLTEFAPAVDDFVLFHYRAEQPADAPPIALGAAGVALCTAGAVTVRGDNGDIVLERGQACFITGDERTVVLTGAGELFLSTNWG